MAPIWDREYLQALLDVEVALAVAEAEVGVIPASCVPDIRAAARAEDFDAAALAAEAAGAGNVVIPLVRKLTDAVAARNPESARYVHRGATSQDIMDTAVVLRLRAASDTAGRRPHQINACVRGVGARACRHADARPDLATACEPNDLRLEGCWMARHARAHPRTDHRFGRSSLWWFSWAARPARWPRLARMVPPSRIPWLASWD